MEVDCPAPLQGLDTAYGPEESDGRPTLAREHRANEEVCGALRPEDRHLLPSDPEVTGAVIQGLAKHLGELGRPLCPCRFYPDKHEEIKRRTWICACDDMKRYKYCHCLLFVRPDGLPITEHLPEGHERLATWGVVPDPTPNWAGSRVDRSFRGRGIRSET